MVDLKPCAFCGVPLTIAGGSANPYGRCDTAGCWMHERKVSVPTDDARQVAQWNDRKLPKLDAVTYTTLRASIVLLHSEIRYVSDVHRDDPCDQRLVFVLDKMTQVISGLGKVVLG